MYRKHIDLRNQQRDKNEADIVRRLRQNGVTVLLQDKSAGYDLLLLYLGFVYFVEVKNVDRRHCSREQLEAMLTPNEVATMMLVQAAGCRYNIITDAAAALAVVGIDTSAKTE